MHRGDHEVGVAGAAEEGGEGCWVDFGGWGGGLRRGVIGGGGGVFDAPFEEGGEIWVHGHGCGCCGCLWVVLLIEEMENCLRRELSDIRRVQLDGCGSMLGC